MGRLIGLLAAMALVCAFPAGAQVQAGFQTQLGTTDTSCAQDPLSGSDGCVNGLSYSVPNFYSSGFPNQSYCGSTAPSGCAANVTVLQPATYAAANRPPWWLPGVGYPYGYPVGIAATVAPTAGNIYGALKDPGTIATDAAANPDGTGLDCQFYGNYTVAPSGTVTYPAPNGGPAVICSRSAGSTHTITLNGYDFGKTASATTGASGDGSTATVTFANGNTIAAGSKVLIAGMTPPGYNGLQTVTASSAGSVSFASATTGAQTVAGSLTNYDCVALVIAANNWTGSPGFLIENNLFLNGPNCNSWNGTDSPANSYQFLDKSGVNTFYPALTFTQNDIFGCAGDNPQAIEQARCAQNFPNNSGKAPYDNHFWTDNQPGSRTVTYNAWLHQPGRDIQGGDGGFYGSNGFTNTIHNNYIEGFVYQHGSTGEHGEFEEHGTSSAAATPNSTYVDYGYNVILLTKYVDAGPGQGSATLVYYTPGTLIGTAATTTMVGNISNNVFISNLNTTYTPFWTTSVGSLDFAYVNYGATTFQNNYMDCTGALYCIGQASSPTFSVQPTISGNVNLLNGETATVNVANLAYLGPSGMQYVSSTGVMTINTNMATGATYPGYVHVGNITGTGAYSSLNSNGTGWPILSVSGNTITAQGPTGLGTVTIATAAISAVYGYGSQQQ